MKHLPSLFVAALVATVSTASAITDAEIVPAALFGKSLTFTIGSGSTPFATNGTWSGTLSISGTSFTAVNLTGNTVGITTACSTRVDGIYTIFGLDKMINGQPAAEVLLYTDKGTGRYELYFPGVGGSGQTGTFTIGATPPVSKGAEISVQQPAGTELVDGATKKSFGSVVKGKTKSKVFTIGNTGKAKLKKLSLTITGANKSDFAVSTLSSTSLAKDKTITFKVAFKPKSKGAKKAVLHVVSSDKDEPSFDINLAGQATAK